MSEEDVDVSEEIAVNKKEKCLKMWNNHDNNPLIVLLEERERGNIFSKKYSKRNYREKACFEKADLLESSNEAVKLIINCLTAQRGREVSKGNKTKNGQGFEHCYSL